MKNFFDFLALQWLCPLCLRCGLFRVNVSFFCKRCETHFLEPRLKQRVRYLEQYNVLTGLRWNPGESDSISELVYLLKSRWSEAAWVYYAEIFKIPHLMSSPAVIIPVPGHQRKEAYHTQYFAQALAKKIQIPVVNCLRNQRQMESQKESDLRNRALAMFQFNEEFTQEISQADRVILIDDIITSGHTLKACLRALKPYLKPRSQVEIIALLSREKI